MSKSKETVKKELSQKIKKAKAELKRLYKGMTFEKVKSDSINVSMDQIVNILNKKVEIVTSITGSQSLLIDGEHYQLEIMLYQLNEIPFAKDKEMPFSNVGLQIFEHGEGKIEEC